MAHAEMPEINLKASLRVLEHIKKSVHLFIGENLCPIIYPYIHIEYSKHTFTYTKSFPHKYTN